MKSLDSTIRAAIAGDATAWDELAREVASRAEAIARGHASLRARGLAQRPDDIADIVTACLERLARNEKRNLARYLEQREASESPPTFDAWLYRAVDYCIRDHLRHRFGRAPTEAERASGRALPNKRAVGSAASPIQDEGWHDSLAKQLGVTTRLTLGEVAAYLTQHLSESEARALRLHHAEERSFAEIAGALGLAEPRDAERLIRRVHARLRHHFARD